MGKGTWVCHVVTEKPRRGSEILPTHLLQNIINWGHAVMMRNCLFPTPNLENRAYLARKLRLVQPTYTYTSIFQIYDF